MKSTSQYGIDTYARGVALHDRALDAGLVEAQAGERHARGPVRSVAAVGDEAFRPHEDDLVREVGDFGPQSRDRFFGGFPDFVVEQGVHAGDAVEVAGDVLLGAEVAQEEVCFKLESGDFFRGGVEKGLCYSCYKRHSLKPTLQNYFRRAEDPTQKTASLPGNARRYDQSRPSKPHGPQEQGGWRQVPVL